MEKLEVVTELRLRREASEEPLRKQLVAKLQFCCGRHTSLNEKRLFEWELREHEPCELYAQALCAYFDVGSIGALGLGHTREAARNWTWATKAQRKAEVHRRRLLEDGSKALVAGLLPVGSLVAMAQRLGGWASLDLAAVQAAELVATDLASRYIIDPEGEVIAAAVAHARTLMDRLAHLVLTPEVRARLAAVACDAACLAGYSANNAGRRGEARRWFADALALAREAKDRRLEALVLASTALTVSDSPMAGFGDRSRSLAALQGAAALDEHLPPAGRAYVNAYLARELAAAGDDPGSGRALERALDAVRLVGRSEPGWGWWSTHAQLSGWDGARATVFTGLRPLCLGRYREAVPLLEGALDGTAVPVRRAALHKDLTRASVGLDEPERARAEALATLDEADAHGLSIVAKNLREVRATFPTHWPSSVTGEIDERLALL